MDDLECPDFSGKKKRKRRTSIKISRPTTDYEYNCDNSEAGIALILNVDNIKGQKYRNGTSDSDAMKDTLLQYGFQVYVCNDLDIEATHKVLKQGKFKFCFSIFIGCTVTAISVLTFFKHFITKKLLRFD